MRQQTSKKLSGVMMIFALFFITSVPLLSAHAKTFSIVGKDDEIDDNTDDEKNDAPDDNTDDEVGNDDEEDDTKGEDETDDEEDADEEDESDDEDIPVDLKSWESSYEMPATLSSAFEEAEKSGTCWEYMNAKYNFLLDETRYWSGIAEPGSDGKETIDKILEYLLEFQLKISNNRLTLEKLAGAVKQCEQNKNLNDIAEPLEQIKLKMRTAGWLIDTVDSREITPEIVEKQCSDADDEVDDLGEHIMDLTEKMNDRVASGDLDSVSNLKELMNMLQQNYGNASNALTKAETLTDDTEKIRVCSGAHDEVLLAMSLLKNAQKFNSGKKEDHSNSVEEIDAKIKMFLSFIAQKRVETLARDADTRIQILAALASAEEKIVATQIAFAVIKYTDDPQTDAFDELLEDIKAEFKPVIDALEESEENDISKTDRRASAASLFAKSRKQIKSLNTELRKAGNRADNSEEQDIVRYVEQSIATDAVNARNAARAFRTNKSYQQAQIQAFTAIHIAKTGKDTLASVE